MGLLDKIRTAFDPTYPMKKAATQFFVNASESVNQSRDRAETRHRGASNVLRGLKNWAVSSTSGRSALRRSERETLVARSQDAVRNHMVATAAAKRLRTNVVGAGLVYRPSIDYQRLGITEEEGDRINELILDRWNSFSSNPLECDAEATLDFHGICSLAEITRFVDGDLLIATPFRKMPGCQYELKFQLIDGIRVRNPFGGSDTETLCDGVKVDSLGAPQSYFVRKAHPEDYYYANTADEYVELDAFGAETGQRRVFHLWNDKDRVGATRGTPGLAPILEPLELLDQFTRAELMAALISSMFTVFIKRPESPFGGFENQTFNNIQKQAGQQTGPSQFADGVMSLGRGAIVDLAPGEDPHFADPSRPNANFDPFFVAIVSQMAAALEIPIDVLMLKYQSSYSAARAAMLEAFRYFLIRRASLVTQFCEPGKRLWLDEAVARGFFPEFKNYADPERRAAYNQGTWIGPAKGSMDEDKEAKGAASRIEAGISNQTLETAALSGRDWKEVNRVRLAELKRAAKAAVEPVEQNVQNVKPGIDDPPSQNEAEDAVTD